MERPNDDGFDSGGEAGQKLDSLAKIDPRKAKAIELRFFAGLSVEETAQVIKVSTDTVLRDWRLGRAWLLAEMGDSRPENR